MRVLDFTHMLAGPSGTMTLADLGADVVKVEEPGGGDKTRAVGSHGAMFLTVNRNKRSIVLDLKHPDGLDIAKQLVAVSDIVVENFRPGLMERLGLGYEACRAIKDDVIYASLVGFGATGPERNRRGLDIILQAESGLMALSGEADGEPLKAGYQLIDMGGGMILGQSVLAALVRRERTGLGGNIVVRLLDVALCFQAMQIAEYSLTGKQPPRTGNSVPHGAPSDLVYAKDGALVLGGYFKNQWNALCSLLDLDWMIEDPRFATPKARIDNRVEMLQLLGQKISQRSVAEWLEEFDREGLLVGRVKEYKDIVGSPQIVENRSLVYGDVSEGLSVAMVGAPYSLDGQSIPPRVTMPPSLGADTAAVLAELGYGSAQIQQLAESGAIGAVKPGS